MKKLLLIVLVLCMMALAVPAVSASGPVALTDTEMSQVQGMWLCPGERGEPTVQGRWLCPGERGEPTLERGTLAHTNYLVDNIIFHRNPEQAVRLKIRHCIFTAPDALTTMTDIFLP